MKNIMKKQRSLKKKPKKPLFFQKSKAAKEDEKYIEPYETEDLPQHKEYEHSPSRVKKRSRYNRQYELSDYDDEYEGKMEDSMQPKQYKYSPPRVKRNSRYNREYEYTVHNDVDVGEEEDLPQAKQYKNSPPKIKRSSRYNREYEYTDYDDEGGQYNYDYEKEMYDSGDEVLEYTTEDTSRYLRRDPARTRQYYNRAETEYLDDSDSDCLACTNRSGHKTNYTSEYPSEYQQQDIPAPRHRNVHRQRLRKRQIMPSETEIERSPRYQIFKNRPSKRSPYHQEYEEEFDYDDSPYRNYIETNHRAPYRRSPQEIYVARAPTGHKTFKFKKHREPEEQTLESRSEMGLDYYEVEEQHEEEIEEPGWRKNQYQSQVFAANIEENQGVFRKQQRQNPRETLLSVTEYDQSVPMVALKNKKGVKPQDESQSIVYLPVVVRDDTIKLPDSKVVHAESILQSIGDKAEKPLETNMNVYVETENGQGNIFQQAQRHTEQEIMFPKDIQVYTTQSTHSIPSDKKPSLISKIASRMKGKNKSKSDYPVQKSYINVVPSRTKPIEQKGSKISIKSGGSKKSHTSSRVGDDNPNSPRGSAYYGKIHKKEMKDRKGRKNKRKTPSDESSSGLLSVINPTSVDNQSNEQRKSTITSTKGEKDKPKIIQKSASQIFKRNPTADNTNSVPMTNLTKQPTFDRHISVLKQPTPDKRGVSESIAKNDQRTSSLLERQCSTGKDSKIITIKDVTNGPYDESKNVFDHTEDGFQPQTDGSGTALPKKKGIGSFLFNKKDSKTKLDQSRDFTPKYPPPNCDPYTFDSKEYTSPTPSLANVQKKKGKEDTRKQNKSPSKKKLPTRKLSSVEFSEKTEEFQFWKVLSFNSNAFLHIYQVVQYFLGLSIHGTLMEILRNFKQSN